MSASSSTARVPGWARIVDALVNAPDRTLTNVELGNVPGVQAFHQRIQDARNRGYLVTDGVRLARGRYAYALVGVYLGEGGLTDDAPNRDDLPALEGDAIADALAAAVTRIRENADTLAKRERPIRPVRSVVDQSRMVRDAVAVLTSALGDVIVEWSEADQKDLLALAHGAGREIERLRTAATSRPARAPRAPRADRVTGPLLMRRALEHCEQPMHSAKIAAWVMANGGHDVYKGMTPAATMAAQLATSNKTGGEFVKVSPGCYGLREWDGKADQFGNALLELDAIR